MTEYKRGDVILANFVFSDETGVRRRPAVIISSDIYHHGRQEAIVAAVTSQTERVLTGDRLIKGWQGAGLLSHCGNRYYQDNKARHDCSKTRGYAPE